MKDFLVNNKDILITTFFICFFLIYFIRVYYHKNLYELKKDNSKNYIVDKIGLDNYPINKYLYTFVKEKRIKRFYLLQSHVLSDLYKIPQKEFFLGVYHQGSSIHPKKSLKKKNSLTRRKSKKYEEVRMNRKEEDEEEMENGLNYSSESSISDQDSVEATGSMGFRGSLEALFALRHRQTTIATSRYHCRHPKKDNKKVKMSHISWMKELKTSSSTSGIKYTDYSHHQFQHQYNNNHHHKDNNKRKQKQINKEDCITVKVIKSNKLLKNIVAFIRREKLNIFQKKWDKINEKIQEHRSMGYPIPFIKFSRPDNLSNIVEEGMMKEINAFLQQHYTRPNEQLNSALNIAKSIEFFLVKKVPLSLLNLNWASPRFLFLLERIGGHLSNKYFNIVIKIKTFDPSFFTLSLKLKDRQLQIENKKIVNKKPLDLIVAQDLIHHFEKYPLKDVQRSIRDPILSIASPFAKLTASSLPSPVHEELSRHITANKHAIPVEIFKSYPDFEKFLNKNFIHRYLYTYRHTIDVDMTSSPPIIFIKYKGRMENWSEVKNKILWEKDGVTLKGQYSQQGIIDEGVYNWTELKPFINRSTSTSSSAQPTTTKKSRINSKSSLHNDTPEDENTNTEPYLPSHDNFHLSSDDDDTLTNGNDEYGENRMISDDDIDEKDMIYESLYNIIDDYNTKYKIFSNIYEEAFHNRNTEDMAEKFIYYDTHINQMDDSYEHTWGSRYLFEYCSWIISHPRLSGDHAWIRLKTPDGNVYSVGLYRGEKRNFYDQFMFPMKIKPCKYMSPDVSEFWKGYYSTISVEITKEQFEKMKAKIEEDQRQIEYRPYQAIKANCVTWASDVAALADIYFPSDLPMIKIIFKNINLQNFARKIFRSRFMSPYFILVNKIWAFFMNIITLLFGAGMIDKKIKRDNDLLQIEPFIRNLKDMADPDKVIIMHPYIIGYYVLNYIKAWRLKQVYRLEKKLNETVGKLKESKQKYSEHRHDLLLQKTRERKTKEEEKREDDLQYQALANDIKRYKQEIKTIHKTIENIKYAIPNKFKKKAILPQGDLYTNCPLKDDEK